MWPLRAASSSSFSLAVTSTSFFRGGVKYQQRVLRHGLLKERPLQLLKVAFIPSPYAAGSDWTPRIREARAGGFVLKKFIFAVHYGGCLVECSAIGRLGHGGSLGARVMHHPGSAIHPHKCVKRR